jgi:hypothetical protein
VNLEALEIMVRSGSMRTFVVLPILQWIALLVLAEILLGFADGWHGGYRFEHLLFAAMLPGLVCHFWIWIFGHPRRSTVRPSLPDAPETVPETIPPAVRRSRELRASSIP